MVMPLGICALLQIKTMDRNPVASSFIYIKTKIFFIIFQKR